MIRKVPGRIQEATSEGGRTVLSFKQTEAESKDEAAVVAPVAEEAVASEKTPAQE